MNGSRLAAPGYLGIRIVLMLSTLIAASARAQTVEVIRGRITSTADSLPVRDAKVTVTSYSGGITRVATTSSSGRFQITFPNGEGDYWISIAAINYRPKRFEVKRVGEEDVLLADTRITPISMLEPIVVNAERNRAPPPRNDRSGDVSGTTRPLSSALLPPDIAGDLTSMASLVPGVQMLPGMDGAAGMFSVFGLGGDQNDVSFNGLRSSLESLPRDAATTPSLSLGTYDVSSGGYSGAQINVATSPGNNFFNRRVSGAGRGEAAEWSGTAAEQQGAKNNWLSIGGMASGPLRRDWDFYSSSLQFDRTFSDLHTLLNTSADGLAAIGVAPDSVTRLLDILHRAGVPVSLPDSPTSFASDVVRWQGNLDLTPHLGDSYDHSFTLAGALNYTHTEPVGSNLVSTVPLASAESDRWNGMVSLRHLYSFYLGAVGIQSRTTIGLSHTSTTRQPFAQLPGGSVLVASDLGDAQSAIRNLAFGGNVLGSQAQRTTSIEVLNQLSWFSANNQHVFKLTSDLRHEEYSSTQAANRLGTFVFNSLADLDQGVPASFTRTLYAPDHAGGQLVGSLALGDAWRPTTSFQMQYGVRADVNHFTATPEENPDIASAFGVSNSNTPNRVYLSPRAGFQWFYGMANQVVAAPGGARLPRALVRGGIGIFQNIASAQLMQPALDATGLSNSTQSISCVGTAAPVPLWQSYRIDPTTIPTACADGSAGTVFSTNAPSVTLFDAGYAQPRSLRASAGWTGAVLGNRLVLNANATVSHNMAQSSFLDLNLNLNRTIGFALGSEAGRPVYVDPSAIVATTGAIAPGANRISAAYGAVRQLRSDLTTDMRVVTLSLVPLASNSTFRWGLDYTLQWGSEDYRGGGGGGGGGFGAGNNTDGDPFALHHGPALQYRHALALTLWYNAFDLIRFSTRVQLVSPIPYTPMVAGDVNGDGNGGNDRAFVYRPDVTTDTALAHAMSTLLSGGAPSGRNCLAEQLGQMAARGSCHGPWTIAANLGVQFNPQKIGLPQRVRVAFSLANPLLLADIIAHGANGLRGWGQNIAPDQTLLYVRGFDPGTRQFRYDVNPRFGSTQPNQAAVRGLSYLSLTLTMDIGPARERQVLTQTLEPGRNRSGNKVGAIALKTTATNSFPNPIAMMLQQSAELKLTRVQADSLATMNRRFNIFSDSVWVPVASQLAALPNNFDPNRAYAIYRSARESTFDQLIMLAPIAKRLLTPAQLRMLPPFILNYLDVRVLRSLRSSTSTLQ